MRACLCSCCRLRNLLILYCSDDCGVTIMMTMVLMILVMMAKRKMNMMTVDG